MRIRKPSDTWLREESATVLLPSLIFASLQWLESQDAKRCTAIKEKTLLFSVPGFSICCHFSESISPMVLVLMAPLLVSTQISHTQIYFDSK